MGLESMNPGVVSQPLLRWHAGGFCRIDRDVRRFGATRHEKRRNR